MYLMIKRVLFCLSFTLLIFGCSDKENSLNIIQSDLQPIANQIDSISQQFSFRDEVSVNGENYKLLISNTQEVESQAIISFAYLPENVEYINNATLTLYSDLKPVGNMEFKIKRLEQDYIESEANWEQASEGITWEDSLLFDSATPIVTHTDTIATSLDSLVFQIPEDEILAWTEKDLNLFSLIIYTESENYIEIYSSEHSKNPVLKFNYRLNSETEEEEYNRTAFKDTFIININEDADQFWDNTLEFSNMLPKKSFLKFDVEPHDFVNPFDEDLDEEDINYRIKHLTVNNAYVRLYINIEESSFFSGTRIISITPFRVNSEVTEAGVIDSENLEYLVNSGTTTKSILSEPDSTQYIDLKITPILQGIISGERENYGIVLRSSNQSRNFDAIKFYGMDAEDESLRPKVHFVYTLPME